MILDADHFKQINDNFGHAAGDACLKRIADVLSSMIGPNDKLCRLGGEEFAIFISDPAEKRLNDFSELLDGPISVDLSALKMAEVLTVTLSGGATRTAQPIPIERQMHQADVALYRAKRQGRARLVLWHASMEEADTPQSETAEIKAF